MMQQMLPWPSFSDLDLTILVRSPVNCDTVDLFRVFSLDFLQLNWSVQSPNPRERIYRRGDYDRALSGILSQSLAQHSNTTSENVCETDMRDVTCKSASLPSRYYT